MKQIENIDYNRIYIIVGKNIKKYRKLNGLTQAELAELCHLRVGFISDLESNTFRTISLNTLYLIADHLNIHIKQLFDDLDGEQMQ